MLIDRAIGIIGVALVLLTGAGSFFFPSLPDWTKLVAYAVGVLLLGISFGLVSAGGLRKRRVRPGAMLRLHIYGDHRTPDLLHQENIFRWYVFTMGFDNITPEGRKRLATGTVLFVTFQDDVKIHTLQVKSPDMALPLYEVKDFNQRYAIISFSDNVPPGTLEVRVTS